MNVLIVEDSPSARKLLRITLEHYGCTVIEARDGVEGLDQATRSKPDFIISDALMPRMDGFQMLREIKSDPELKEIPFIFYSSTYTGDKESELALTLGADAFVVKPAEPEELWKQTCSIRDQYEKRNRVAVFKSIEESDEQYLREYSRIVAKKLEEKVIELEESLALRTETEEELRRLNAELTREIAERKRIEIALKEQELELATIFENSPFIMFLLDSERRICRVNAMAYSISGTSISNLLGLRSGEALRCIHSLDSPEGCGFGIYCNDCIIRNIVLDTFENGNSHHQVEASITLTSQAKEQTFQFLISTTKVIVNGREMVLLSLQDISDFKKLESQLLHSQKMESIGTLAGGIAHDFNNILTVIIGYGDMALNDMGGDDPMYEIMENILKASRRAAALSKDLLLFSRKQVSDKINVDLNDIVRSVEKFLRRIIGEDILCSIRLNDEKLLLFADPHQLEQVLMNLATNARDAITEGGSLSISTERIEPDGELIEAQGFSSGDSYALLTVTDTGIGMNEETSRQIFDPFFTTKEIGKGTGLGLAVVYGIIKEHNGQISVASAPGKGTTFRIYLPLLAVPVEEAKTGQTSGKPTRGTETILMAEDDESVRQMVRMLLINNGYRVIEAVDGEDAVNKFRENSRQIDLLFFDMIMPKKSGFIAYNEIREINPEIKIIFASGYATDANRQKIDVDANACLISKPYYSADILTTVRRVLDQDSSSSSP